MRKIIIILTFIFLLNIAFANLNCFQEGCSNLRLHGSQSYTLYGSNLANTAGDASYESCSIGGSLFNPLITDFIQDGNSQVVRSMSTGFKIYDRTCTELYSIDLGDYPESGGAITNMDNDAYQELFFVHNTVAYWYEYDDTTDTFVVLKSITNASMSSGKFSVACDRNDQTNKRCYAWRDGDDDTYVIDYNGGTIEDHDTFAVFGWKYGERNGYNCARLTHSSNDTECYSIFQGAGAGSFLVVEINDSGDDTDQTADLLTGTSTRDWASQVNVARLGEVFYIFVHGSFAISGSNQLNRVEITAVLDTNLNVVQNPCSNPTCANTENITSNWMVADYDQDGVSEACIIVQNKPSSTTYGDSELWCYDDTMTRVVQQECGINASNNLVMADFFSDNTTMAIADATGIWSTESSTCTRHITSGYVYGVNSTYINSTGHIFSNSLSSTPYYVYTDDTQGYILSDQSVSSSCGDGTCQYWENAFTCGVDCGGEVLETGECNSDADCDAAAFPTCWANECVNPGDINETCAFDRDCRYEAPFCFEGLCVINTQIGLDTIGQTTGGQDISDEFNLVLDPLIGANPTMRFVIGMALIMAVAAIGYGTMGIVGAGLGAFVGLVISTVINLIPAYILIITLIFGVVMIILGFFRRGGGG